MPILNLTQHPATPEQLAAGVFDPTSEERAEIVRLLTFEEVPDKSEIKERAYQLALTAYHIDRARYRSLSTEARELEERFDSSCALIGGAPYLMSALEEELKKQFILPLYAFSVRESVEQVQPDGSVRKTATFRHQGFIQA